MKILFIHNILMPFVAKDLDILREEHEVREVEFTGKKGLIRRIIPDLINLWQGALWCDITFSWFGKLHAFFAILFSKILGKKAIVVAGGDDVAKVPEIGYGLFTQPLKMWCPLFVFRYADLILCVSKGNMWETIINARANEKKIRMIYHGFDSSQFRRKPEIKKEELVLTVARITWETIIKKGILTFVKSAAYLPDVRFVVVGPGLDDSIGYLKRIAPPNVEFTGGLYNEALVDMFNRAKVYAQVSYGESFGCSIAEAMLCECVPVVSRERALPEVGGNFAFYANHFLDPEEVARQIEKALHSELGNKAKEWIEQTFPLEKRRMQLLEAVGKLDPKGQYK